MTRTPSSAATSRLQVAILYGLIAIIAILAFGWPFLFASQAAAGSEHSGDAWLWSALLGAVAACVMTLEIRRGTIVSAQIAVLGVLSACIGILRIVTLPGGGNSLYFLLILAAAAFGPRFGVLLGLTAMAASAVITAGVGPWLPFQMLAFAFMGWCAGIVGAATARLSTRVQVGCLAAFGWCFAFVFGALMNLWSWPLIQDGGATSYAPALGIAATARHYWAYYVATSFAWDASGALANFVLIMLLGGPILAALRRHAARLRPAVIWTQP